MRRIRILVFAAVLAAACLPAGTAHAWSCLAVAGDGTWGLSWNFPLKKAAINRALMECATRTTTDEICEIRECHKYRTPKPPGKK